MSEFFKNDIMSGIIDQDAEFIPLLTNEEEENMNKDEIPENLPILPIRNNVLFPGVVIPITVGRDKSIKLVKDANKGDRTIGVVTQKNQDEENPSPEDLCKVGTTAQIMRTLKMPDGSTTVIIQGKKRFEIQEIVQEDPYFVAKVNGVEEVRPDLENDEFKAVIASLRDLSLQIIKQSPNIPSEASMAIKNIESPAFLVNFISSNLNTDVKKKQEMLEEFDLLERSKAVLQNLTVELQMLEMKNEIQTKVKHDMDKQQREFYLHQQMRTIQEELGEGPVESDVKEFEKRAKKKKWSKEVQKTFDKEMQRLKRMNPQGAEYSVQINYIDLILDLPWNYVTEDKFDLKKAKQILDRDHASLEKVKERILEYLAVLKLKNNMKAPIICLYGPPGVGKTSLGKSIAEAIGRKYVRMSLGGMHDEAEIRGHRRTYIGAMPGRILQNLKKAGSSNPVFVLDEIDKLSNSTHGDPSSALLEVLDPEQNAKFNDNFVEMDYDLSKVMFIATANNLATIQPALRDRMEIIHVPGYPVEEKLIIAKKHLIPKLIKDHGMKKSDIKLSNKVIEKVIEEYTNESGVRTLEKRLAKVIRNRARQIAMEEEYKTSVSPSELLPILGPSHIKDKYIGNEHAGVVTGLAWTQTGGDILYIETSLTKGKGKLTLTGNLGDVMKESAVIALEYLKSHAMTLNIDPSIFERWNVHVHVPEGATPKDGPSAGITILSALASAFTQRKIKKYIALTGEITLRGDVLPVGGIKEKILAAKRAGIKEIVLCHHNKKDVDDIKQDYLKGLEFHYVKTMSEVLDKVLLKEKVKNPAKID